MGSLPLLSFVYNFYTTTSSLFYFTNALLYKCMKFTFKQQYNLSEDYGFHLFLLLYPIYYLVLGIVDIQCKYIDLLKNSHNIKL